VLTPPKAGMPFVKGQSEGLLRIAMGDERTQLQTRVHVIAARMRERMAGKNSQKSARYWNVPYTITVELMF